jgi:hypothetical protein
MVWGFCKAKDGIDGGDDFIAVVGQDQGDRTVCVYGKSLGSDLDNARRIVACVNACDTVDTEQLEIIADAGENFNVCFDRVKLQRDQLLALVKAAYRKQNSEYLSLLAKYAGTKFESDPVIQNLKTWVKNADDVIAIAEHK